MLVAKLSFLPYKQCVTLPSVYLITAVVKSTVQIIYFFFFLSGSILIVLPP